MRCSQFHHNLDTRRAAIRSTSSSIAATKDHLPITTRVSGIATARRDYRCALGDAVSRTTHFAQGGEIKGDCLRRRAGEKKKRAAALTIADRRTGLSRARRCVGS